MSDLAEMLADAKAQGIKEGRAEALAELTQKHKFKCNQCKHFIKNIHRQAYGRCDIKNTESDKINFRSGSSQNCKLFESKKE